MNKKILMGFSVLLFLFSVVCISIWFLCNNKKTEIKTRYEIGAIRGTYYEEIANNFQRVSAVKLFETNNELCRAVAKGKVDVAVTDRLKGLVAIKKGLYRDLTLAGPLLEQEIRFAAFNRADDALRQAINRGLYQIIRNNIYSSISERYFGCDIQEFGLHKTSPDEPEASDGSWERVQRTNKLVIALRPDNPPFSYLNEHNELIGFEVEIAWAICIQLGIKYFQTVPVSGDQILKGLKSRFYDSVWGISNNIKEKQQEYDFSDPYCQTGPQLFVRKGSPIKGPEMLAPPIFPEPPPLKN